MSPKMTTTMAFLMIVGLSTTLVSLAGRKEGFLTESSSSRQERMSEEDVQTTLLAEVEGSLGEGSASSRVKQFEAALATMYAALPKNEKGYLGHATVHYALHRVFVQRHGWSVKGLDSAASGGHRNSTSGAGVLKENVPAYVQDLFEQRLGGRGFALHEVAVVAATIEHLVHNEAIKRMGEAFSVHDFLPTSLIDESTADEILDTYMTAFVTGEDLPRFDLDMAKALKPDMPDIYMAWNATQDWVREVRRTVAQSDSSAEQKASGKLDFALVARVAERVSEQFGDFQNRDCKAIKARLLTMEQKGSGRVGMTDFYQPPADGLWQFQDSWSFLRQAGALDESDPAKPRVVIANYINSKAMCIGSSSFYSICCMNECDGLLGHLEQEFAAPEATPARILGSISKLSTSSVVAPRELPSSLIDRLQQIAAEHGGSVPFHGRLFAQWMHHAFPRECPYPHVSGTTSPESHHVYNKRTGEEVYASDEELATHKEKGIALKANPTEDEEEIVVMPWAHEEELLVVRQPQMPAASGPGFIANMRNFVLFVAMGAVAYGLGQSSRGDPAAKGGHGCYGIEKVLV